MKNSIQDRSYDSYRPASGDKSKIAVTLEGDSGLIEGVQYDDIQVTYPDSLTENYEYYLNSVLQATVQVTYQDTAKRVLLRARRI